MFQILETLESVLGQEELTQIGKILDGSYNTFMNDCRVWSLLELVIPSGALFHLKPFKAKIVGHKVVNAILLKYYHSEKVIKYEFTRRFLDVSENVIMFEICVNSSRMDVARINGKSFCYEIKSKFDNLSRIEKQLNDYLKAFEYVYAVIHSSHFDNLLKILPEPCGIIILEDEGRKVSFEKVKESQRSPYLCYKTQLDSLSSNDMKFILRSIGVKNIPRLKRERAEFICKNCNPKNDFNFYYKEALKNKYIKKSNYLKKIFDDVEPLDIQAFYHSGSDPFWVYYKNSSIV